MDTRIEKLVKTFGSVTLILLSTILRTCLSQDDGFFYMKIEPSPARVYPGATEGTAVATVTGFDNNGNPPSSFLIRSSGLTYFSISPKGVISTSRTVSDVVGYTYEVDVYAYFGKIPRVNLLEVIVSRKNEFAPVFDRPTYNFLVYRQQADDIDVGLLKVRDDDTDEYNRAIQFAIVDKDQVPFVNVHPKLGRVTITGTTMPRDESFFSFNVSVTNTGSPPLASFATVIVDVTDLAAPRTFCLYIESPVARVCWKNPIENSYVDHYRLSYMVTGMNHQEQNVTVNGVDSLSCSNVTFGKFGVNIDFYLLLFNGEEWSPYSKQKDFTVLQDGWLGRDCDEFSACLVFQPCLNGADCLTGEQNTFTCNCTESWNGTLCQDFNMCSTDPCQNGGSCTYISNYTYSCACAENYFGENCEFFDECANTTCLNNGRCVRSDNGSAVCECPDNLSGRLCDDEDPCKPNPCINGYCYKINGTDFQCECTIGYSGDTCQYYDECLKTNPCRTGGTCYSVKGVAYCRCTPPIFGDRCEFTDACQLLENPCNKNGNCHPMGNIFRCNCSEGYYGRECQYLNMCVSSPCKHGRCLNISSSDYQCTCESGYYGKDCQFYDYCIDEPCKDFGLCLNSTDDYTCDCYSDERYGKNCQFIDGCKINICENGANCVNISGTGEFTCECLPGFYGALCGSEDGCRNKPCENNGKCVNISTEGDYRCDCPSPEFFGVNCEKRDYCFRKPCKNNGTCVASGDVGYQCVCPDGFEGRNCEELSTPCKTDPDKCDGSAMAARKLNELLSLTEDPTKVNPAVIEQVAGVLEDIYPYTLQEPNIAHGMTSVTSNVLLANDSVLVETAKGQSAVKIVNILDKFTTETADNTSITTKNVQLFAMDLDPTTTASLNYNLPLLREDDDDQLEPSGISISIPNEAIVQAADGSSDLFRVKFTSFRSAGFFISPSGIEEMQFKKQKVVTASFGNKTVHNLTSHVVYEIQNMESGKNHSCVYWDTLERRWSSEGVITKKTTGNMTTCLSSHLTSFAILLDPDPEFVLSETHQTILTYISYIGVAISIICIVMTLLTYSLFRCLNREKSGRILLNLLVALLLLNIFFILGAERLLGHKDASCVATAICLHYFLLATLFWMAVEAVNMYQLLVTVFARYSGHFLLKRCAVAWGVPALIVTITACVDLDHYRSNQEFCFLSATKPYAYYAAILAPACIILAVNTFVFIKVSWVILKPGFKGNINATNQQITPAQVRGAFTVLILVGVTWVLGPFAINEAKVFFNYLFCILNSLQGCFIFVFRCLFNPEAKAAWIQLVKTGTFKSRRGLGKSLTDSTSKSHANTNKGYSDTNTYKTHLNNSNPVSEGFSNGRKSSGNGFHGRIQEGEGFSKI